MTSIIEECNALADVIASAGLEIEGEPVRVLAFRPPRDQPFHAPFVLIDPADPFITNGQATRSARGHWRVVVSVVDRPDGVTERQLYELTDAVIHVLVRNQYPISYVTAPGEIDWTDEPSAGVQLTTSHDFALGAK